MSGNIDQPQKRGISGILADKGSRRMLLFAGVAVLGIGAFAVLHHSPQSVSKSHLNGVPTLADGNIGPVPRSYAEALHRGDQERFDNAVKTKSDAFPSLVSTPHDSALPTPLGDGATQKAADPVIRPTLPSEPSLPHNTQPRGNPLPEFNMTPAQPAHVTPAPVVDHAAVEQLQQQLSRVLVHDGTFQPKVEYQQVVTNQQAGQQSGQTTAFRSVSMGGYDNDQSASGQGASGAQSRASASSSDNGAVDGGGSQPQIKLPAAGTVLYAKMVGEVNSDSPGPVIAEILQGPLTGSRLLGSFSTNVDNVIISFTSLSIPYTDDNGDPQTESIPIKAVAVDQSKLGTAMATSVDRHLLTKVGLTLATGFLQGFGQAISASGSSALVSATGTDYISNAAKTTPQELWMAGGTAAGKVGDTLQQEFGSQKTTIKVAADTPFGLLFLPAQ